MTEEQAGSFGSASFCSLQRMAYSRALTPQTRKKISYLQKYLLCQDYEKDKIALELQYENCGGFYNLSPSLYPLCIPILLNRHLILPSVTLPEVKRLIHAQVNDQKNIEDFKKMFPAKILSKYNEDISKIQERWVTFMCRKYAFSKLKQANFGEVGMGLRDYFNFGHMQHTKKRKQK